ncbi:hypothetical protein AAFF_G00271570 [Aldrovandia affinis]|uniref:CARD domain-containing protein n=1 Tax=Aldrovandia affinis TaxID=143900 RepID=A0AAD7RAQ9_9TELE|nr:hypothetical protein AAFF_G00271570 [Aldrovandia affinis]
MAVDDLIRGVLDNLKAENLDKFKHKLSTLHKIGYGLIEKETNVAITGRIIENFGKKNAIARTAEVLREIGVKNGADDLEDEYAGQGGVSVAGTGGGVSAVGTGGGASVAGTGGGASAAGTGGGVSAAGTGGGVSVAGTGDTGGSASGSGSTQTEGQHFVEKQKLELIERVRMVESILDQLLHQELIDGEQYEFVMDKTTTRGRMRRLLHDVISPGGRELKDELYRILEEKNPALMRDLKGK